MGVSWQEFADISGRLACFADELPVLSANTVP